MQQKMVDLTTSFFLSFLISISITFLSQIPQSPLRLILNKILLRPRQPNRSKFCEQSLQPIWFWKDSEGNHIFKHFSQLR